MNGGGRMKGEGERGRTEVRTACPLDCWDTCGLVAVVDGGRVVGLKGDPDHPVTRGRLCPKARFQLDRHRSAPGARGRLTHPLVRTAGGELGRASWPAALDLVAGRLLGAKERYGSLSILHYWDAGSMGQSKKLYHRLFNLLGGVTEPVGSLCWGAGLAAQEADFGKVLAHSPEDVTRSEAVIIWGRNPADTSPHLLPFLRTAKERGAEIWVVDPLPTATVRELGARHVAPRPGTDAVLALAVAGELVRRGSYDKGFCLDRASGFPAFARAVAGVGAEKAAAHAGVIASDITGLAELLERRRPTAFLIGYGVQRHARGGEAVRAIDALAALAGSIGVPGGGANYANLHTQGLLRSPSGEEFAKARRFFDQPAFGRQVRELKDPPVTVLYCNGANPLAQLPSAGLVAETWRAIPFKVVAELVLTDTAALSDVVLPVADFLEDEDLYFCAWHTRLVWSVPATDPPGEAWPEWRIIAELAARLGLGEEFTRPPAEWISWMLEPLSARLGRAVPRGASFGNPAAVAIPWADGSFATPSGRFEFGTDWESLRVLHGAPDTFAADGSFCLITPQHRLTLHSQFYDRVMSSTGEREGLPAVHVSPRAAGALGLEEGGRAVVRSREGRLICRVVLEPGLRDDTVYIYSGGPAGLAAGAVPASVNLLTSDRLTDMGGQAAYYSTTCEIEPG